MTKIDRLSLVAGVIMVVIGIILLIASVFVWYLIFYALFLLALGIAILFTLKEQEHIELIKKRKK